MTSRPTWSRSTPTFTRRPTPSGDPAGCEAADFAAFPAGAIALMQRGSCDFGVKADNAEAAGATGVVIFNRGTEW